MLKKIISVLLTVLLIICIGLCTIVMMKNFSSGDKSVFGYRIFYIISGSMEPTIPTGSAIVVHREETYEEQDIITFESSDVLIYGYPNTHRIVQKTEVNGRTAYVTKGDANMVIDDTYVFPEDIYGKVVCHTGQALWLGSLIGWLMTPFGFMTAIVVPILVVIGSYMRKLTREYKQALKEEAQLAAQQAIAAQQALAVQQALAAQQALASQQAAEPQSETVKEQSETVEEPTETVEVQPETVEKPIEEVEEQNTEESSTEKQS